MVLPQINKEGALKFTDRLVKVISQAPFQYEDRPFPVTISAGITTTVGEKSITPVDLICRADEKLYQAKHDGRNSLAS